MQKRNLGINKMGNGLLVVVSFAIFVRASKNVPTVDFVLLAAAWGMLALQSIPHPVVKTERIAVVRVLA
jgi:hypothetical protein